MNARGQRILGHLRVVADVRARLTADAELAEATLSIKAYQHLRFTRTHADLLADARYGPASRFFLDELYGPRDFSDRDAQFVRIVPALVRLFPDEIVATVETLAALHALSESLDVRMARRVAGKSLTADLYVSAWQTTTLYAERAQQIEAMLAVGRSLDRYTRSKVLRHTLRVMRRPAAAAGLAALQGFLERGFDTFGRMGGAEVFLGIIAGRERALAERLFAAEFSADGGLLLGFGELP